MKRNNIENIGTINTADMTLMECIEMYVKIESLSDSLKADVEKAIIEAKPLYEEEHNFMFQRYDLKWGNSGFDKTYQLEFTLYPDSTIEYFLSVFYEDKECEDLCDTIRIDLPECHKEEFKRIAFEALMKKFSLQCA